MAEADPRKTFEMSDADERLRELLDRARAGEEVILVRDGVAMAKLVPYAEPVWKPRRPGRWKHLLGTISEEDLMAPCFTDEELDRFYNEDIHPDLR